ncbi:hypothetical protein RC1_3785 [Rhodospirillum centenum SW]|uniref:Uncharacterized protein n=2 Tax=Rhodospirillum centenum TaxID=34018 RepID=B6IXV4_RHOCS|nr:hypothetical protein RC1_3785 [Rhodospirillum centenum SW]
MLIRGADGRLYAIEADSAVTVEEPVTSAEPVVLVGQSGGEGDYFGGAIVCEA